MFVQVRQSPECPVLLRSVSEECLSNQSNTVLRDQITHNFQPVQNRNKGTGSSQPGSFCMAKAELKAQGWTIRRIFFVLLGFEVYVGVCWRCCSAKAALLDAHDIRALWLQRFIHISLFLPPPSFFQLIISRLAPGTGSVQSHGQTESHFLNDSEKAAFVCCFQKPNHVSQ